MKLFSSLNILTTNDIKLLTKSTIDESKLLLSKCIKVGASKNVIRYLDEISNLICCSIDPLTACSKLHPNIEIQNEANNATKELEIFINELNNNYDIYNLLNKIKLNNKLFNNELNYEEQEIINTSLLEIKLSTNQENNINNNNNNIKLNILNKEDEFYRLCHDYNNDINHNIFINSMKNYKSKNKRKEIFNLFYSNYDIRLNILQNLREERHKLALNIGYESFSKLKSQTSLFNGDLNKIEKYLLNINKSIENQCKNEIKQLLINDNNEGLKLWDMAYINNNINNIENNENNEIICLFKENIYNYLTIENCLQSLQRLMNICFNIEMDKCLFDKNNKILKYELKKPITNELIGIIYFDLFERENKSLSECITYPLYCSFNNNDNNINKKQISQVIMSMNINNNKLNINELITMYHEFGHCLHYLLSNTQYQTLSGSRGLCMQYLEFPSTFFENFIFDRYFLKYIIMDNELLLPTQNILNLLKNNSLFSNNKNNLYLMQQIYDSLLDLSLFGNNKQQNKSIKDIVYNIYKPFVILLNNNNEYNINDALNGYLLRTSRFYHFIDYPSNYYSYIMAQKLSNSIWQNTFGSYDDDDNDDDSFEKWKKHMRYYGNKLNNDIFKYGSVKSPIQCLNEFNGKPIL